MKDINVFNFIEIVLVFVFFKIFKESFIYFFLVYIFVKFLSILLVICIKLYNKYLVLKIYYFISGKGDRSYYFFFGLIEKIILLL